MRHSYLREFPTQPPIIRVVSDEAWKIACVLSCGFTCGAGLSGLRAINAAELGPVAVKAKGSVAWGATDSDTGFSRGTVDSPDVEEREGGPVGLSYKHVAREAVHVGKELGLLGEGVTCGYEVF